MVFEMGVKQNVAIKDREERKSLAYLWGPLNSSVHAAVFARRNFFAVNQLFTVLLSLIKDMASIWLHRKFHELIYKSILEKMGR